MSENMNNDEQNVFELLCSYMDENDIKYDRKDEDNAVFLGVNGDDLPMGFGIRVIDGAEIIKIYSPLPIVFKDDKKVDGALATCFINFKLAFGSFQFNYKDGTVLFVMSNSYAGSLLSKSIFHYIIGAAISVVDRYNDRLAEIANGDMSLEEFVKSCSED